MHLCRVVYSPRHVSELRYTEQFPYLVACTFDERNEWQTRAMPVPLKFRSLEEIKFHGKRQGIRLREAGETNEFRSRMRNQKLLDQCLRSFSGRRYSMSLVHPRNVSHLCSGRLTHPANCRKIGFSCSRWVVAKLRQVTASETRPSAKVSRPRC